MVAETSSFLSFGVWLSNKISDKGFDDILEANSKSPFDKKFYEIVKKSSSDIEKLYPDAFGGNIDFFFKDDISFQELMKLLFFDSKINKENISQRFDKSTLPDSFLVDFIKILKSNLLKSDLFNPILTNKEIYLTVLGINKSLKEIENKTNLSVKDIKFIKNLLEEKFKNNFSITSFIKKYNSCLINNYSIEFYWFRYRFIN